MTDIEEPRKQADAGSVVAQSVLGIRYLHGYDVERNHEEALRWLSAASVRGASRALVNLGTMYEHGLSTEPNIDVALELYERGARRGEFLGCIHLARFLANGASGQVDEASALMWYSRAAEQRDQVMDCDELREADAYVASRSGPHPHNNHLNPPADQSAP